MYHDDTSGRQVTLRPTLSRCSAVVQSLFSVHPPMPFEIRARVIAPPRRQVARQAAASAEMDGSSPPSRY
jgi:hypothetical protein